MDNLKQDLINAQQAVQKNEANLAARNSELQQKIVATGLQDLQLSKEASTNVARKLMTLNSKDFKEGQLTLPDATMTSLKATHKQLKGSLGEELNANQLIDSVRDGYMNKLQQSTSHTNQHVLKAMATAELMKNKELFPELAHLQHKTAAHSVVQQIKSGLHMQNPTEKAQNQLESQFFDHGKNNDINTLPKSIQHMVSAAKAEDNLSKSQEELSVLETRMAQRDPELYQQVSQAQEQSIEIEPERA